MSVLDDVCNKLYILEENIETLRNKLYSVIEENSGDLLNPQVILVSKQLDSYIYKYTYLKNLYKSAESKCQKTA